jgi:sucrose-6-phosphate hydrolase SacC (GH32 family)
MRFLLLLSAASLLAARPDLVISGFEEKTFAGWQVDGDAFGAAPHAPSPQDGIVLFEGTRVAYSGRFSFALKGTLISPAFPVERAYISFLVAGERERAGDLGVELLLDGKVLRAASATHFQPALEVPNHSYRDPRMAWRTWDVRALTGHSVRIRVNDASLYGAIAVDQFIQTDTPKSPPADASIEFRETYRPQFHFTTRSYWGADPNGLFYYGGQWHLFYQHRYPGGGVVWGHATSPDLLRWTYLAPAVPAPPGGMCYSGTGLVDTANASGLQRGKHPPLLLFYTHQPAGPMSMREGPFPKNTQDMAYSVDGGHSWTVSPANPVLRTDDYRDRDPKVLYHSSTRSWIMVLSLSANNVDREKATYGIFRSTNLKNWELTQKLGPGPGFWECPDLFRMEVAGEPGPAKWVLVSGNGHYMIGSFDGRRFEPETGLIQNRWGGHYYATQTFSDAPRGRRVQMGWMNTSRSSMPFDYPGMPFNQQMAFPRELTLRRTPEGLRLFRYPIGEIERLYGRARPFEPRTVQPGDNLLAGVDHDLLDIDLDIELPPAAQLTFQLRGETLQYDAREQRLRAVRAVVPAPMKDGRLQLRVLLDRTSIEVFVNGGQADASGVFFPLDDNRTLSLKVAGAPAKVRKLEIRELRSIYDSSH